MRNKKNKQNDNYFGNNIYANDDDAAAARYAKK